MEVFEPESLRAVAADQGQYHFLAITNGVVRLFRERGNFFCPASGGLAPFPQKLPGPLNGLPLHEPFGLNPCRELLFEGRGVRVVNRGKVDIVPVDATCLFGSTHAKEPRINSNSKSVKDRGLAGGVIADKEIEVRIELDPALSEFLEILDRQLLNLHDSPLFFSNLV
jgi:hypothetical protein